MTDAESIIMGERTFPPSPDIAPPFLVISILGRDMLPGVPEAVNEAARALNQQGVNVRVYTRPNICYIPHFGLGAMKNFALMDALEDGATYWCLMDNDVLVRPDTFIRLMQAKRDVVVPYYIQDKVEEHLMYPQVFREGTMLHILRFEAGDGGPVVEPKPEEIMIEEGHYMALKWAVMSCMLFDTKCFAPDKMGERPFTEVPIAHNEEYNCLWWRRRGIKIWQDLSCTVNLLRAPTSSKVVTEQIQKVAPGEFNKGRTARGKAEVIHLKEEPEKQPEADCPTSAVNP